MRALVVALMLVTVSVLGAAEPLAESPDYRALFEQANAVAIQWRAKAQELEAELAGYRAHEAAVAKREADDLAALRHTVIASGGHVYTSADEATRAAEQTARDRQSAGSAVVSAATPVARAATGVGTQVVSGYRRKDGTYVESYRRRR